MAEEGVKRYEPDYYNHGMIEDEIGEYVLATDYERLKEENKAKTHLSADLIKIVADRDREN